jgi:hypothetical protein
MRPISSGAKTNTDEICGLTDGAYSRKEQQRAELSGEAKECGISGDAGTQPQNGFGEGTDGIGECKWAI